MPHTSSTLPPPDVPSVKNELLPLFVGITGHRDIHSEDVEPLREAVKRELQALKARYPHTPMIALSPLGEGADRVVACAALEQGFDLMVPLPLPRALYEESFESNTSRAEFAELLGKARTVWTLPWVEDGHEKHGASVITNPTKPQIEAQYAAMGAYLARYSHVLFALWDGDDSPENERTGGTAHIVRLRLHGAPPPYGPVMSPLERAGYGAVHHILTPRQSRALPEKTESKRPFGLEVLPDGESAEDFSRIDMFNADVQKYGATLGEQAHRNGLELLGMTGEKNSTNSASPTPDELSELQLPLSIYGWSDSLSTYFSRQVALATRRIFGLVFLAALCFNLFHSLPHSSHHEEGAGGTHAALPSLHLMDEAYADTPPKASADASSDHAKKASADASSDHAKPAHADAGHGDEGTSHATNSHAATPSHGASSSSHGATSPHGDAHSATAGGGHSVGVASTGGTHAEETTLARLWGLLPWFLWFYLALVGMNLLIHGRAEKEEWQNKYQDYRALAEGLRVQIFWRLAGLHEDVSDHYLGKQRGELNWIRHAIKSCNVLADAQRHHANQSALPLVVRQWAAEQRNYYIRKTHREHAELEKQEKIIRRLVIASVALSVVLGLLLTLPALLPLPVLASFKATVEAPLTHALIMIAIVMLAVTAGLLHGYNAQLARAEHTKRYGRMGTLFQAACVELEAQLAVGHTHKATALLHELGREALAENGDWLMLHRERPLEVPHAG